MAIRNQAQKAQLQQAEKDGLQSETLSKAYKIFDPNDQPNTFTGKKTVAEGPVGNRAPAEYSAQSGTMYTDHLAPTYGTELKRVQPKSL